MSCPGSGGQGKDSQEAAFHGTAGCRHGVLPVWVYILSSLRADLFSIRSRLLFVNETFFYLHWSLSRTYIGGSLLRRIENPFIIRSKFSATYNEGLLHSGMSYCLCQTAKRADTAQVSALQLLQAVLSPDWQELIPSAPLQTAYSPAADWPCLWSVSSADRQRSP